MTARWAILLVMLTAVGVGGLALAPLPWLGEDPQDGTPPQAAPIRVVQGIGYTEPASELRRLTFELDGVIADCPVTVGQQLQRGEVIMRLENSRQQAAVNVARAELALAQAELHKTLAGVNPFQIQAAERLRDLRQEQLDHAVRFLERMRGLASRKAITPQELEDAETQVRQLKAALAQQEAELLLWRNFVRDEDRHAAEARMKLAQAQLEAAEEQLKRTILVAPMAGTVLDVLKREGDGLRMAETEPVAVFGDLSRLRVRAELDERYASRVHYGQQAVVFGRNLGREHQGRIVLVKPMMGDKSVFSHASQERKDLDIVEVLVELDEDFQAPVGLRVDVAVDLDK